MIESLIQRKILKVSNCVQLHWETNSLLQQRFSIILLWFDNFSKWVYSKSLENCQLIAPEGLQLILNLNFYETGFSSTKRLKAYWICTKRENIFSVCMGSMLPTSSTPALPDLWLARNNIWPTLFAERSLTRLCNCPGGEEGWLLHLAA